MYYSKSLFSFNNPLPALLIGKIESLQESETDIDFIISLRKTIDEALEWFQLYLYENPNINIFFEINDFYNDKIDLLFNKDHRVQFYQFVKSDEFVRIIHMMIIFKFSSMKFYDYIIKDYISVIKENANWIILDKIRQDEIIMAFCFMIECDLQILNFKTEEKKIFKEENKVKSKICILLKEEKYQLILPKRENFENNQSNYEILDKNDPILLKFKLNKFEDMKNERFNKNEKDNITNEKINEKEEILNNHFEIVKLETPEKKIKCDFCKDFLRKIRYYKLKCTEDVKNKFRNLCTDCFSLLVKMKLMTDIESKGKRDYSIECFNKDSCVLNRIEFYKKELQKIFVENDLNDIIDYRERLIILKKKNNNNNNKKFCEYCCQENHPQLVCGYINNIFHSMMDKLTVCFHCFSFNPRKIESDITKCMFCDLDYCTHCMQLQLSIEYHFKEKMHSHECKFSKFKAKEIKKLNENCTICMRKETICTKMKNRSEYLREI